MERIADVWGTRGISECVPRCESSVVALRSQAAAAAER
jgi:hypothetical protein